MAKKLKRKSTFISWVNEIGVMKLGVALGVDASTIHNWKRGYCWPRTDQMQKIKRMSKGLVTYDELIDGPHAKKLVANK